MKPGSHIPAVCQWAIVVRSSTKTHKRMYASTAVNNASGGIPQAYVNQSLIRYHQNLNVCSNQIYVVDISKLLSLLTYSNCCFYRKIFFLLYINSLSMLPNMPDDLTKISKI